MWTSVNSWKSIRALILSNKKCYKLRKLLKDLESPWEGLSKEKEREKDLEIVEGADREYEKLKENDFWLNE